MTTIFEFNILGLMISLDIWKYPFPTNIWSSDDKKIIYQVDTTAIQFCIGKEGTYRIFKREFHSNQREFKNEI